MLPWYHLVLSTGKKPGDTLDFHVTLGTVCIKDALKAGSQTKWTTVPPSLTDTVLLRHSSVTILYHRFTICFR
jgi:hypothetical protein